MVAVAGEASRGVRVRSIAKRDRIFGLLVSAPGLAALLLVILFPLLFTLYTSIHDYTLIHPTFDTFTAADKYVEAVGEPYLHTSVWVTIKFVIASVVIEFIIGFTVALMLNTVERFKTVYYLILMMPLLINPVVVGLIWRMLLHAELGIANYAIGFLIPDELRANQDAPFDMDRDGTLLVTQLQMIRRERAFAADFMAGSVWGTTVQGTVNFVKWSDYGGSDPLTDLRNALRTVQLNTGRRPNKIVMGQIVWDRLVDHPDLIDRIKGGATSQNPAIAQPQLLAALLNLDEVLIGQASYDSAVEGGTFSGAMILDDDLLMLYTPRNPGLLIPAAGYTFVWESMVNGRQAPQFIRKVRLEREKADVVEAHAYWDQVATETQSGYFFQDCCD